MIPKLPFAALPKGKRKLHLLRPLKLRAVLRLPPFHGLMPQRSPRCHGDATGCYEMDEVQWFQKKKSFTPILG